MRSVADSEQDMLRKSTLRAQITANLDTSMAQAFQKLMKQLEQRLSLSQPLDVFLAGGMAVNLYTGCRVTDDVDAEFGLRVLLPKDLVITFHLEDGSEHCLYVDTNYNSTFGLMHEDYQEDSVSVDCGLQHLRLHVLSPVDLAVSKIKRLADNDREDISELVRLGLTTANEIESRATAALANYIGNQSEVLLDIKEAVAIAGAAESASARRTP